MPGFDENLLFISFVNLSIPLNNLEDASAERKLFWDKGMTLKTGLNLQKYFCSVIFANNIENEFIAEEILDIIFGQPTN